MFTTKELQQILLALSTRQDRLTYVRDFELEHFDPDEDLDPQYWDTCLEVTAQAISRIEQELAMRDKNALAEVNAHFRKKRAAALAKAEAQTKVRKAYKSEMPSF